MEEIIIKIPEEIKEVIELNVSYERLKGRIKELEREEKAKNMLSFLKEVIFILVYKRQGKF